MPRRPYPWPSSKIDPALMRRLHLASVDCGVPLTELVRVGVVTVLAQLEAGHAALEATSAADGRPGVGCAFTCVGSGDGTDGSPLVRSVILGTDDTTAPAPTVETVNDSERGQ